MGKKTIVAKKRLNILALISVLLLPLVFVALLVPWYRAFVLRDDTIGTILIQVGGAFVIGLLMVVLGSIALARNRKYRGTYYGSWLGIAGIAIGAAAMLPLLLLVIDYLRFGSG